MILEPFKLIQETVDGNTVQRVSAYNVPRGVLLQVTREGECPIASISFISDVEEVDGVLQLNELAQGSRDRALAILATSNNPS